jgi:hypothetical protein
VLALGASLLWLSGCGTSERDKVQAKVEQFLHATATKDYKTLCDQVLAPSLLERFAAVNLPCQQGMQIALGGVKNPTLSIGRIIVNGSSASAITLTSARGQQGSLDAIGLVRTRQGWRVQSLGSPVAALAGHKGSR